MKRTRSQRRGLIRNGLPTRRHPDSMTKVLSDDHENWLAALDEELCPEDAEPEAPHHPS